jgi:hypothetical protein
VAHKELLQKIQEPIEKEIKDLYNNLEIDLHNKNWQNLEQNSDRLKKVKEDIVAFREVTSILSKDTIDTISNIEQDLSGIAQLDQTIDYLEAQIADKETSITTQEKSSIGNLIGDIDKTRLEKAYLESEKSKKSGERDNKKQEKQTLLSELENIKASEVILDTNLNILQKNTRNLNKKIGMLEAEAALQGFDHKIASDLKDFFKGLSGKSPFKDVLNEEKRKNLMRSARTIHSFLTNENSNSTKEDAIKAIYYLHLHIGKAREELEKSGWKIRSKKTKRLSTSI